MVYLSQPVVPVTKYFVRIRVILAKQFVAYFSTPYTLFKRRPSCYDLGTADNRFFLFSSNIGNPLIIA